MSSKLTNLIIGFLCALNISSCDILEPKVEYVEVPVIVEVRDTVYVALTDTIYFRQPSSFSIATYAELAVVGTDSVGIEYSYSATKMDSSAVDSLFLIGYLLNWDKDNNAVKQLMDKTRVAVEPLYADSWDEMYARGYGSFWAIRNGVGTSGVRRITGI